MAVSEKPSWRVPWRLSLSNEPIYVVYDGECPFCSRYVTLIKLRDAVGHVKLINARENHPIVERVVATGAVLDNEMALVMGNDIYVGAECINRLALMSTDFGLFNRMNALVFSSPTASRLLYPVMRTMRNATLKVLSRKPIGR